MWPRCLIRPKRWRTSRASSRVTARRGCLRGPQPPAGRPRSSGRLPSTSLRSWLKDRPNVKMRCVARRGPAYGPARKSLTRRRPPSRPSVAQAGVSARVGWQSWGLPRSIRRPSWRWPSGCSSRTGSNRLRSSADGCVARPSTCNAPRSNHAPDEITSITRGADLAHLLPSEFALLTDGTLEDLFYLKLAEGQLNQYELVGNEPQGQGPVILALDGSGSMSLSLDGAVTKEVWSKAVMLAVLAIANKQGRECAVIQFGTAIRTWRFPKGPVDPQTLVECSDLFMNASDEDYPLWMDAALALVDEAAFDRADVICIADGLSTIDAATRARWQARRQRARHAGAERADRHPAGRRRCWPRSVMRC